ncbi:hypothetical protein IAQ61_008197 [Plenodomus lingam]|uniref:uncharacterized protein n=1 Tax=Leptosphaeria maculans TaxID=5022 RepID=UPI0033207A5E|nr:hypothetical protein IAQ61_008197 [Plenodomus lingam]
MQGRMTYQGTVRRAEGGEVTCRSAEEHEPNNVTTTTKTPSSSHHLEFTTRNDIFSPLNKSPK